MRELLTYPCSDPPPGLYFGVVAGRPPPPAPEPELELALRLSLEATQAADDAEAEPAGVGRKGAQNAASGDPKFTGPEGELRQWV